MTTPRTARSQGRRRFSYRRRRGESGTALIELAIIAPLMIALVLGAVDFAALYSEKIVLRTGVREAARQGVQAKWGSNSSCPLAGTPPADLAGDNAAKLVCLLKRRADQEDLDIRVKVKLIEASDPSETGYNISDALMLCAMRKGKSATGFYSSLLDTSVQRSRLSMLIEVVDAGGLAEWEETPLPGTDWSFCDPAEPLPS